MCVMLWWCRKSYGVSKMLEEPVPYFDLIKECYPHYYCMTGREGDPVYIERSGQVDQVSRFINMPPLLQRSNEV